VPQKVKIELTLEDAKELLAKLLDYWDSDDPIVVAVAEAIEAAG